MQQKHVVAEAASKRELKNNKCIKGCKYVSLFLLILFYQNKKCLQFHAGIFYCSMFIINAG